jgi:AcrR family transcriptional regulator
MKNQASVSSTMKTAKTEQKIMAAAIKVFQDKGYAGTRTRDIAEEAGINLALLNYYFRSKEKLFEIIMLQSMGDFMQIMTAVINNEKTTLEQKIGDIIEAYHELLYDKPGIPIFILSELRQGNHTIFLKATGLKKIYQHSVFAKQYEAAIAKKKYTSRPMIWMIMNLMSMTIFPFIASPLLQMIGDMNQKEYRAFLKTRKPLVVKWVLQTMKS